MNPYDDHDDLSGMVLLCRHCGNYGHDDLVSGANCLVAELHREIRDLKNKLDRRDQFITSVATDPLLDAVGVAGLTEQETEGPTGGGGIDHTHTIRYMGQEIKRLKAELVEAQSALVLMTFKRDHLNECNKEHYEEAREERELADELATALDEVTGDWPMPAATKALEKHRKRRSE